MSTEETYLAQFHRGNGSAPPWLRRSREDAIERFASLGFPTPRLEEWKYTNVAPIAQTEFRPATEAPQRWTVDDVARLGFATNHCLAFTGGNYAPDLSSVGRLPRGARIASLASALESDPDWLQPHLARLASCDEHSFTALNTAFLHDGAVVYLPRGAAVEEPIHILFAAAESAVPTVAHPRVLVLAEESSQATIVETHIGRGSYLTNAVTEIFLGANARLHHYKLQRESEQAFHVARVEVRQAADSQLYSHAVSLGGALARTDVDTVLAGSGANCTLDGLYMTGARQHVDHHTAIDHQEPHCSSRELYKGVLDGSSTGVFNGKVYVRPNAQKSDAGQVNKNLLLSESAVINTKPQLEIFADDVKCSHGATIGRLDEEAIFYLRSRGIGAVAARSLLTYAFANEVISRMNVEPVRSQLDAILWSRFHELSNAEARS